MFCIMGTDKFSEMNARKETFLYRYHKRIMPGFPGRIRERERAKNHNPLNNVVQVVTFGGKSMPVQRRFLRLYSSSTIAIVLEVTLSLSLTQERERERIVSNRANTHGRWVVCVKIPPSSKVRISAAISLCSVWSRDCCGSFNRVFTFDAFG